ncbi:MAG: hypothetical protein HKN44_05785 [Ilumatobacter sp.]|nr:hypothetical protein [Ilumatobacter sp.]
MGFFKDLRKVSKMGKEMAEDFDPAAQMRTANEQMQQMTTQNQLAATGLVATATVNALRDTGTQINYQPVLEVDVTVLPDGGAPFPATATVNGHAILASLTPGSTVSVRYDPADPSVVALA